MIWYLTRDLLAQSLATVSKANTADMQPLMSKLDTLLRSLLADFSTDNAGKLPDIACIRSFHAEAFCLTRSHLLCAWRDRFVGLHHSWQLELCKVQGQLGARKDKR